MWPTLEVVIHTNHKNTTLGEEDLKFGHQWASDSLQRAAKIVCYI